MGNTKKTINIVLIIIVYLLLFAGSLFIVKVYSEPIGAYVFPKIMAMDKSKPTEPPKELGIVNYEKLILEHPDYNEIKKYDSEINSIAPDNFDPRKLKEVNEQLAKKFDKFRVEIEKELMAEGEKIKAESQREAEALKAKSKIVADQKKIEFAKYSRELEKEYQKAQNDPNRPVTKWEQDFRKKVEDQTRDLRNLVEQQITAKKLELEKNTRERLLAEEKKLERTISEYEDSILKENRDKKVNLQLQVSTAKDDEERQRIQEELGKINSEEEKKVSAKRKEVTANFQVLQDQEREKNNKIMDAYKNKLEQDYVRQIKAVRDKVGGTMVREKVKNEGSDALIPENIRKKLVEKRKIIEADMRALEAQTNAGMREIEGKAKARFEDAKAKLNKKMIAFRTQLSKEFEEKRKEMIDQQVSANKEKEKAWENLKKARDRKYKQMLEDINKKVEEVAKEKNVKLVIGTYTVNIDGEDLNTSSLAAVRKMK